MKCEECGEDVKNGSLRPWSCCTCGKAFPSEVWRAIEESHKEGRRVAFEEVIQMVEHFMREVDKHLPKDPRKRTSTSSISYGLVFSTLEAVSQDVRKAMHPE